jgi:hypothetical protein
MTEEHERLWRDFQTASKNLKKATPTATGGSGNENAYAAAYKRLVAAGLAMKLRGKYR